MNYYTQKYPFMKRSIPSLRLIPKTIKKNLILLKITVFSYKNIEIILSLFVQLSDKL